MTFSEEDEVEVLPMRHRLRADIHKAFRPPKKLGGVNEDLYGMVEKVARKSGGPFKPPSRAGLTDGSAAVDEAPRKPRPPCRDAEVQAEVITDEALRTLADAMVLKYEEPPRELPLVPKRPQLVKEEASAAQTRVLLKEERRRLLDLDNHTTRLTKELIQSRRGNWEQQRALSSTEAKISRLIRENCNGFASEDEELARRERVLSEAMTVVRAKVSRWSLVAKRQDQQLQQEIYDKRRSDVHSLIAKHPAGDVFLPPLLQDRDSDSSDFDDHRGPRQPWARRSREDVALASSDEEDSSMDHRGPPSRPAPAAYGGGSGSSSGGDAGAGAGGGGHSAAPSASTSAGGCGLSGASPPPPPGQRWRKPLDIDPGEVSDESMPSPGGGGSDEGESYGSGSFDVASEGASAGQQTPKVSSRGAPASSSSSPAGAPGSTKAATASHPSRKIGAGSVASSDSNGSEEEV